MDAQDLWVKAFLAAIGGVCADPNIEHAHVVTSFAEEVADSAVVAAARRGIVVADGAGEP